MEGFRQAIDDSLHAELELHDGKFTWERSRGKPGWVKERLDRCSATQAWWNFFPLCKLSVNHALVSDHDPLFLDLVNTSFSRKIFRFRFENTWLREPNFRKDVSDFWMDMPAINILPKLISVSGFMARWGRNEKLNTLLLHEETYWKQQAKNYRLAEGDANTKIFHATASARKKTNQIAFLENDQGEQIHNHEDMCQMVKDYFTKVFTTNRGHSDTPNLTSVRCVTTSQNADLVAELTFDEFTAAVKQMHPDKASRPDGLNPAFSNNFGLF
ncbi:uncharacterized protein LOC141686055 [Apium graveolens]|uniref:uncharacterized protein LOC141686055 n=1 Tax=Apium graveolens TaxID=4045 RepID=UPI003D7B643D